MKPEKCTAGHIRTPETTYWHSRRNKKGESKKYRECATCVKLNRPSKKKQANDLDRMAVVRDDWSNALDCPMCHSLLQLDEDGHPKCVGAGRHSPRAFVQAVMMVG